jgi:hypothetical protein
LFPQNKLLCHGIATNAVDEPVHRRSTGIGYPGFKNLAYSHCIFHARVENPDWRHCKAHFAKNNSQRPGAYCHNDSIFIVVRYWQKNFTGKFFGRKLWRKIKIWNSGFEISAG